MEKLLILEFNYRLWTLRSFLLYKLGLSLPSAFANSGLLQSFGYSGLNYGWWWFKSLCSGCVVENELMLWVLLPRLWWYLLRQAYRHIEMEHETCKLCYWSPHCMMSTWMRVLFSMVFLSLVFVPVWTLKCSCYFWSFFQITRACFIKLGY